MPLLLSLLLLPSTARSAPLPVTLQAELIVKIAGYEKGLRERAGDNVRTLVVARDTADDAQWSQRIRTSLGEASTIAGLPHSEVAATYSGPADLVAAIKAQRAAVVVVSGSLGNEVEGIRAALDGVDVLALAPDAELVRRGIVLGFELVSGKPRLFFNQSQATRQRISMSTDVMKLMTVFP